MVQEEFKNYELIEDNENPFSTHYKIDDEHEFIIEGNFYSQLTYLKSSEEDRFEEILNELINNVMKNKKVIFTADYENPSAYKDDFIYQEIEDITNKLNIYSGFISFGNEYGD